MVKINLNLDEAKEVVESSMIKIVGNNRITVGDVKKLLNKDIDNNNIKIKIEDFIISLATLEYPGKIRFKIKIFDKSTKESEIIISEIIIQDLRNYTINKYKNRAKQLIKEKKYRKAYRLLSKVKKLKVKNKGTLCLLIGPSQPGKTSKFLNPNLVI